MSVYTPKFESVEACIKEAGLISNQQNKVAVRIQLLATSLVNLIFLHGNWTIIFPCIEGVSKCNGINKTALIGWFESSLKAEIDLDLGSLTYDKGVSAKDIDMDQVSAVNWFDFKPKSSSASSAKSLAELCEAFSKASKKSVKAGKMTHVERDGLITTFEALISEHVAPEVAASA